MDIDHSLPYSVPEDIRNAVGYDDEDTTDDLEDGSFDNPVDEGFES